MEMDVVEDEYIVVARVVVRGEATGCAWWLILLVVVVKVIGIVKTRGVSEGRARE